MAEVFGFERVEDGVRIVLPRQLVQVLATLTQRQSSTPNVGVALNDTVDPLTVLEVQSAVEQALAERGSAVEATAKAIFGRGRALDVVVDTGTAAHLLEWFNAQYADLRLVETDPDDGSAQGMQEMMGEAEVDEGENMSPAAELLLACTCLMIDAIATY